MRDVDSAARVGDVEDLSAVVVSSLRDGVGESTGRIDSTEENVDEGVAAFLARKPSEDDGGDVRVVVERFHVDRSGGVKDDGPGGDLSIIDNPIGL